MVKMRYRLSSDGCRTVTVQRNLRVVSNYGRNEVEKKDNQKTKGLKGQMENGVRYSQHDT